MKINLNPSEIKKQFQLEKDAFFFNQRNISKQNYYYLADLNMVFIKC